MTVTTQDDNMNQSSSVIYIYMYSCRYFPCLHLETNKSRANTGSIRLIKREGREASSCEYQRLRRNCQVQQTYSTAVKSEFHVDNKKPAVYANTSTPSEHNTGVKSTPVTLSVGGKTPTISIDALLRHDERSLPRLYHLTYYYYYIYFFPAAYNAFLHEKPSAQEQIPKNNRFLRSSRRVKLQLQLRFRLVCNLH